ncbi:transmembrane channel-like protein isoform X2 [Diabrotica virgifera virgifera]|uniref:TMC domain-containing protein n=1 Tax=Diabrotica virgifera virgifera TaxID=50390 RepID=A0ABM5L0A6_DIAVI|nr:transmembrane channel-like protein isoform X2 [Diabrotica virgifera virgifera]
MEQKENANTNLREAPPGILRLDFGKPRSLSAEFKYQDGEPTSPQPSNDRLSVTFADESISENTPRINFFNPLVITMDIINAHDGENSDDDDYSASANAIIQRTASQRKSKRKPRRSSSPFTPDILPSAEGAARRASVFTNSSGDTAITMDENIAAEATQEEIFENIKLHKEVLSNVRMQPWNMRKKLKLVIQAKAYIKKHEGVLQERLAQSRSTKDWLARWHILLIKRWHKFRREMQNFSMWFIPWELKIKEIESHFGSVVASYFTFLRWLFWVNVVVSIVLISFVTIPELLIADPNEKKDRKIILEEEKYNSTDFMTLWKFDGILKYTPLFYGWYSDSSSGGYNMPIAYFVTGLAVYGYSFFATLRKMAENSRVSKLSEKDDECVFTWKVFTAWDYMIANAETAHNRVAAIVMGFKEALLEEAEKKKVTETWRVVSIRVMVNVIVIALLALSMYIVVLVVKRSTEPEAESSFWRKNEIPVVISALTFIFPIFFEVLGIFEQYHPRKQLRLQLGRIMVLNLVNLYSLIFALIAKVGDMTEELQTFRHLLNDTKNSTADVLPTADPWQTLCQLECIDPTTEEIDSDNLVLELVSNISTYMLNNITSYVNESSLEMTFLNNSLISFLTETVKENVMASVNVTADNMTVFNNQDFNFTDLEYKFVDYLTYILDSVSDFDNLTFYPNDTSDSNSSTPYWEYITTTILPLFTNGTDFTEAIRFDDETTPFSSTSITLPESVTTVSNNCTQVCTEVYEPRSLGNLETGMNYTMKARFRSLCWETMFGQELIGITVWDLIMTIVPSLGMDFFRGIFVRVMNRCWCWDLEKKFPKYGDFKVAENILSLVNNQGMVWMGMFFCPGLVLVNVVKLYITMYFKAWAVMTCNVPPEVIFRASRSNNFYYALLLSMLFLCVLPVGYTIVWIKPSWHCGPFSKYGRISYIFTETVKENVPYVIRRALDYIASPGIVIPLLVLLVLIIYYLMSLTNSLREANEDLKIQLRRERTEERRKMFQLADRRRRGGSGESNEISTAPSNKWKRLLENLPSGKSLDETPKQESEDQKDERVDNKSKDFFSKLIKRALRKSSTSEDAEDGTDTEQHDSLPYDTVVKHPPKPMKPSFSWGSTDFQNVALRALQLKKNKPEIPVHINESKHEQKHVHISEKPVVSVKTIDPYKPTSIFNEPSTSRGFIGTNRSFRDLISHIKEEPANITKEISTNNTVTKPHDSETSKKDSNSKTTRQDSESSNWSDGIPVITISKTDSDENMLRVIEEPPVDKSVSNTDNTNVVFRPKVKCVLKKQSTEFDEDTIVYFNNDIEKNISMENAIKAVAEEDVEVESLTIDTLQEDDKSDEVFTDKSSSDTEPKESSTDTVLEAPLDKEE